MLSRRLTGWRLALASLLLAAFALQSYVVQTHIHLTQAESARLSLYDATHGAKLAPADHHDRYPANDDPANCPICQEILHSGQFVTPSAQALLPPSLAVSTIAVVDTALPFLLTLSHSWRGRAPPHS
jgi:hypothetical protein